MNGSDFSIWQRKKKGFDIGKFRCVWTKKRRRAPRLILLLPQHRGKTNERPESGHCISNPCVRPFRSVEEFHWSRRRYAILLLNSPFFLLPRVLYRNTGIDAEKCWFSPWNLDSFRGLSSRLIKMFFWIAQYASLCYDVFFCDPLFFSLKNEASFWSWQASNWALLDLMNEAEGMKLASLVWRLFYSCQMQDLVIRIWIGRKIFLGVWLIILN